jgi:hypothetical protein
MTKLFYVDRAMCGGDELPEDFDLEEFCEEPQLISEQVFYEALGEYCHR